MHFEEVQCYIDKFILLIKLYHKSRWYVFIQWLCEYIKVINEKESEVKAIYKNWGDILLKWEQLRVKLDEINC